MRSMLAGSHTGYWQTVKHNEMTGGRWAHVKCAKGGYRDDDTILLVNPAGNNSIEEILADMEMKAPKNHRTMFADEDDNVGDANMTPASQTNKHIRKGILV